MLKIVQESALRIAAACAVIGAMSGGAWAEPSEGADPAAGSEAAPAAQATERVRSASHAPVAAPVWVSQRAAFRVRPEFLVGGDLGGGSSGVPAPLGTGADGAGAESDLLAWASIRLRYNAEIHVGQPWTIHIGFDALDNLVMGSTHRNAGGTFDEGLWRDAQGSPSAGVNGFGDALEVRHAYASWRVMEFLDLRVGRMPEQRALGLWRQTGTDSVLCPDCDFGTYVDGAQLGGDLFGFRLEAGWEISATGATSELPGMPGQPMNLDVSDDVTTWTIGIGRKGLTVGVDPLSSLTPEEQGAWVFDWSVHAAISDQSLDTSTQDLSLAGPDCAPLYEGSGGTVALPHDCWRAVPRDASIYRPGAWFRARWRPTLVSSLRLELEFSALIGDIGNTQGDPSFEDTSKSLRGFGGALEVEYTWERLQTGLDVGFATGDDGDFLGVLDGQSITVPDDTLYLDDVSAAVRNNRTITSFWFHRDYHVDLILFRQVNRAVTNAVYVRPWVSYKLLDSDNLRMGARFDFLYAAAANPKGTPGDGDHWGVEMDASAWIDLPLGFGLSLHGGVLVPLDALNDRVTGAAPEPAFALRSLFSWRY